MFIIPCYLPNLSSTPAATACSTSAKPCCRRHQTRPIILTWHQPSPALAGDDIIAREQLLDFLRNRMYRETLLCHAEREVTREYLPEQLRCLDFASQASSSPGEKPGAKVFTLPGGIKMETSGSGVITLMEQLEAAWPRALSFAEIEPELSAAGFVSGRIRKVPPCSCVWPSQK